MKKFKKGGYVRIILNGTGVHISHPAVFRVGEIWEVTGIWNDGVVVATKDGGSTLISTKPSDCYKTECEWIGMKHPDSVPKELPIFN